MQKSGSNRHAPNRSSCDVVAGFSPAAAHPRATRARRLDGAGSGARFLDDHPRGDLPLRRGDDFQSSAPTPPCARTVRDRQVGLVAIAAQVAEHRAAQLRALGEQQRDDARRRLVGKMPVPARDALFHRPGRLVSALSRAVS